MSHDRIGPDLDIPAGQIGEIIIEGIVDEILRSPGGLVGEARRIAGLRVERTRRPAAKTINRRRAPAVKEAV